MEDGRVLPALDRPVAEGVQHPAAGGGAGSRTARRAGTVRCARPPRPCPRAPPCPAFPGEVDKRPSGNRGAVSAPFCANVRGSAEAGQGNSEVRFWCRIKRCYHRLSHRPATRAGFRLYGEFQRFCVTISPISDAIAFEEVLSNLLSTGQKLRWLPQFLSFRSAIKPILTDISEVFIDDRRKSKIPDAHRP